MSEMFIFGWNFELRSCQRISKLYVAVEPQIVSDSVTVDCSMPVSSVLHYLPEFAQIHVL